MSSSKPVKVTLQRSFTAPSEKVFDAWVIPTLLGSWMFGPKVRQEEIIRLNNSPRVGGEFSYVVKRQGETINHVGSFLEIRRPEKLRFSWGVEDRGGANSTVSIELREESGKTRLKLSHQLLPEYAAHADRVKQGWATMCDALAALLDKQSGQKSLFR